MTANLINDQIVTSLFLYRYAGYRWKKLLYLKQVVNLKKSNMQIHRWGRASLNIVDNQHLFHQMNFHRKLDSVCNELNTLKQQCLSSSHPRNRWLVAWLLLTFLAALYTCAKFHVVLSTVLSITELCILYKTQNFLLLNYFFRFIRSRFDWFKVITFRFRNHFHGKCKHDLMTIPSPKKLVKLL